MPIIDRSQSCALPQTEKLCYRAVTILASQSGLFLGLPVSLIPRSPHASQMSYCFGRLLDDSVRNEIPKAYADLSDHTLPITDIACGFGPFPSCRVLTASTDHSVKVWLHFFFLIVTCSATDCLKSYGTSNQSHSQLLSSFLTLSPALPGMLLSAFSSPRQRMGPFTK